MPNPNLQNFGAFFSDRPSKVNDASPFLPGSVGTIAAHASGLIIPSGTVDLPTGGFPRYFQYVQLKATSASPAFGQLVVWSDHNSFVVTTESSTTKRNDVAGIVVNPNATLGNYIWILVSGVSPVLNEAATTPAAGDVVIGGPTTAGRTSITAQGTAPLALPLGVILGTKTTAFGGSSALPTDTCAARLNFPLTGRF